MTLLIVLPYYSAWSSLADKTVMAKRVKLWTTIALVRHTEFQRQSDSNCNSACLVVKLQATWR